MVATGLPYSWPRTFVTRCEWLTPMPSTKRPPVTSPVVWASAFIVIASRA
jgi:hypothetical protein